MKIAGLLPILLPLSLWAQVNTPTWGVKDTVMVITKTTDYGPVHDYIELFNNSGQELQMRWICSEPNSWPTLWETNFSDPNSNYTDVQNMDSADFTLFNPIGWSNKLIIGVNHLSYAWNDTVSFKVWPLTHPEDSLWLHYVIQIAQGTSWASLGENSTSSFYLYDVQNQTLQINFELLTQAISFYDLSGKLIKQISKFDLTSNEPINVADFKSGMYIVNIIHATGTESFKVQLR